MRLLRDKAPRNDGLICHCERSNPIIMMKKMFDYKGVKFGVFTEKDIEEKINSVVRDVRLRRRNFDGIQFVRLRRRTLPRGLLWRFCFSPKATRGKGSGLRRPIARIFRA